VSTTKVTNAFVLLPRDNLYVLFLKAPRGIKSASVKIIHYSTVGSTDQCTSFTNSSTWYTIKSVQQSV